MKCCYVTLLSTENYLPGVVALARSLILNPAQYKPLVE